MNVREERKGPVVVTKQRLGVAADPGEEERLSRRKKKTERGRREGAHLLKKGKEGENRFLPRPE